MSRCPRPLRDVIEKAYSAHSRQEEFYVGPDCAPDVVRRGRHRHPSLRDRCPTPPCAQPPWRRSKAGRGPRRKDGARARDSDLPDPDSATCPRSKASSRTCPATALAARAPGVKTVLVVDDEPEIRALLERLLKSKGYRVVSTDNGRAALGMVKEHAPDLILLDAMLPEVHGFDIARRIKASKRYAHIPIVMVSAVYRGWRFAEDLRESCGVEHFVEKPFKIADVLRAVEAGSRPRTSRPARPSARCRPRPSVS